MWKRKLEVAFLDLASNPKAEDRRWPRGEALFFVKYRNTLLKLPRFSDLSRSRKELYRELMVSTASDPLVEQLGWSLEEIRFQWNWAPGSSFLNNSMFSLTWWLAWNPLPLRDWTFKAGLADMPDYPATVEEWKKRIFTHSTTASGFARFGVISRSGQLDP